MGNFNTRVTLSTYQYLDGTYVDAFCPTNNVGKHKNYNYQIGKKNNH